MNWFVIPSSLNTTKPFWCTSQHMLRTLYRESLVMLHKWVLIIENCDWRDLPDLASVYLPLLQISSYEYNDSSVRLCKTRNCSLGTPGVCEVGPNWQLETRSILDQAGFLLHVLTTLFHLRVLLYLINEELLGVDTLKLGRNTVLVYYCLLDVNLL